MSFLNEMAGKAVGAATGETSGIAGELINLLNNQPGGLSGLVQNFHNQGLGSIVSSWVGTGQNLPISAEQIQNVLGNDKVQQLAAKVGISPDVASSKLAELLPNVIDKLTPDGQVPEGGDLMQKALGLLGQKL